MCAKCQTVGSYGNIHIKLLVVANRYSLSIFITESQHSVMALIRCLLTLLSHKDLSRMLYEIRANSVMPKQCYVLQAISKC